MNGERAAGELTPPDYSGGSLVNLVAELEHRLTGSAPSPRLHPTLAAAIPEAATYVLMLFDGLGDAQLDHPAVPTLRTDRRGRIDAPFPTTTTVSLATIATGLDPARHGLLGYQLHLPDVAPPDGRHAPDGVVANTIKWTTLWGDPLGIDTTDFLPAPNLWERCTRAGVEAVCVQPEGFADSPLSRLLYRGARFEGTRDTDDLVTATAQLAEGRNRLIFAYYPGVDFAAHVAGQDSPEYAAAMSTADTIWSRLAAKLPDSTTMIGTADHGHVDIPRRHQTAITKADHTDRVFSGDGRVMIVDGDGAELATRLPATWVPVEDMEHWWGPGPMTVAAAARRPSGVLVADPGTLLLHRHSDDRMIGNHGGLTPEERHIPLLVTAR